MTAGTFLDQAGHVLRERRNPLAILDKYMGDAIMAFWNAPLSAEGHAA